MQVRAKQLRPKVIVTKISLDNQDEDSVRVRGIINKYLKSHNAPLLGTDPRGKMPDFAIIQYKNGKPIRYTRGIGLHSVDQLRQKIINHPTQR